MKLLENELLESAAVFFKNNARDFDLDFRLEAYSCKFVSKDNREWRRNFKTAAEAQQLQPLSPPEDSNRAQFSTSPFSNFNSCGRLRHSSEVSASGGSDNDADDAAVAVQMVGAVSRRTLFNLVAVLNLSYNDYDFAATKSDRFSLANLEDCMINVTTRLATVIPQFLDTKEAFWSLVDTAIEMKDCTLYSYIPEYTNDPFTEDGCVWAFNYLFYNRNLKRILFLCCRALHELNVESSSSDQLWLDDN